MYNPCSPSSGLSVGMDDAQLSKNKRRKSVVTVPFLTPLLLGKLFSDMVRVIDRNAGDLGSNPDGPRRFSLGIISLVAAVIR